MNHLTMHFKMINVVQFILCIFYYSWKKRALIIIIGFLCLLIMLMYWDGDLCCVLSCSVQLFVTPWTVTHQAPLSMGFPRQEYCSGLLFPSLGDLPNPGIEPTSPTMAGRCFTSEPPGDPKYPLTKTYFLHDKPIL